MAVFTQGVVVFSRALGGSFVPSEALSSALKHHGLHIFKRNPEPAIQTQERCERSFASGQDDVGLGKFGIGSPFRSSVPHGIVVRDALVAMDVGPAVDRNRKGGQAPNQKTTIVEMVEQGSIEMMSFNVLRSHFRKAAVNLDLEPGIGHVVMLESQNKYRQDGYTHEHPIAQQQRPRAIGKLRTP